MKLAPALMKMCVLGTIGGLANLILKIFYKQKWSHLPGPYQPSHEMMLMFYAFYKQATVGPCNLPKPAFWDVINKAKWNAWSKLGNMSSEDAMKRYVEEIKKV